MAATAPVPALGSASAGLSTYALAQAGGRATHLQDARRPTQTSLICTGSGTRPCWLLIDSCRDRISCYANCAGVGLYAALRSAFTLRFSPIWVDGGARNPKVPTLFQVADVDTGVINWINADLVTHICPRV